MAAMLSLVQLPAPGVLLSFPPFRFAPRVPFGDLVPPSATSIPGQGRPGPWGGVQTRPILGHAA
eukprot:4309449-Pyramimonas_sp.AAC.1